MEKSKLLTLFKTFEKKEWRRFRDFLNSPYFNKRKDILQLYQYVVDLAPEFPAKKLRSEVVFKKIFPNQAYDDKQLKYLMNYLIKQVEEFLIQQRLESERILKDNFLLSVFEKRQLDKHYLGHFKKVDLTLENIEYKDSDYWYHRFQLADIANWHYINQNQRKYDNSLQNVVDYLDRFYFLNKLKYSCEMVNRSKVLVNEYNPFFIDEVVDFLDINIIEDVPLIAIYLQIYFMLRNENGKVNFERLKQLLVSFPTQISATETRMIYLYGINFCLGQVRKNINSSYYIEECLKLYTTGIEQEFLFTNGYLSPWTFKNTVRLGLNLKRYNWTEEFIKKYHVKLVQEFQEDALHYNLADLAFRRKNYKDAQHHLLFVEYSDIFYTLEAKEMLLKIYYENHETEALFALIASFSIYLRRNKKIAQNIRATYLNFTSLLQKTLRAKPNKIPKLIEKIKATKLLTNRSWLLAICEDLK